MQHGLKWTKNRKKRQKNPLHNTQMLYSKLLSLKRKKDKKERGRNTVTTLHSTWHCAGVYLTWLLGVTAFCKYLHERVWVTSSQRLTWSHHANIFQLNVSKVTRLYSQEIKTISCKGMLLLLIANVHVTDKVLKRVKKDHSES